MGFMPAGSNAIINIFIICVIVLGFLFKIDKISFKQFLVIGLVLMILTMIAIKLRAPKPEAKPAEPLSQLINSINQAESINDQ